MGDVENNFQPSKKRSAGVQLSRDNPGLDDDDETSEQEAGTFKRATEEVLASRRIVKVRRQQTAPSNNPFAAISLTHAAPAAEVQASSVTSNETKKSKGKSENEINEAKGEPSEVKEDEGTAKQSGKEVDESKLEPSTGDDAESVVEEVAEAKNSEDGAANGKKSGNGTANGGKYNLSEKETENDVKGEEKNKVEASTEKTADSASFGSFQQLSSGQNAFSGLSGTGFSSTSFSFGSAPKDGSSSTGSLFGLTSSHPTFNFDGVSNNGGSSYLFGIATSNNVSKSEESKFTPMQEVPVETGEEKEKAIFIADSALFEFTDGLWKERGKGELKVNVSTTGTGKARLIMRARGNYRLILNAILYPNMKLTNMEKKGITFNCVNSACEGKASLSTIALKFKDPSIVDEFRAVVVEHKDKAPASLETLENSPTASDE